MTAWRDLFAHGWMRVATLLFIVSLAWHAWVGVRDILMDYIKPDGLRLALQVLTLLLLGDLCRLGGCRSYGADASASSTPSWSAPAAPACAPRWSWRATT